MYRPRLNPDEHVLITSDNVHIKGRSFTAILTNKRLILADGEEGDSVETIEYETGSFRTVSASGTGDTLDIEVDSEELTGNLALSFPGVPPRTDELDDWASALHMLVSKRRLPEDYLFEPTTAPVITNGIDALFEPEPEKRQTKNIASKKDRKKLEKERKKEGKKQAKDEKRREKKVRKKEKAGTKGFDERENRLFAILSNIFGYLYAPGRLYRDSASKGSMLKALIYFLICFAVFSVIFSFSLNPQSETQALLKLSFRFFIIFVFCELLFGVFLHIGTKIAGGRGEKSIVSTYRAIMYSVMPFVIIGWFTYNGIYYGFFIAILWSVVIMIRGISVLHEISVLRALISFLLALILAGVSVFIVNKAFFLADKIEEFNMLKSGMNISSTVSSSATSVSSNSSLPETIAASGNTACLATAIPTMTPLDEFENITVTGQAVIAGVSKYTATRTSSQMELPTFEAVSGPQSIQTINHTFRFQDRMITLSLPIDERIYLGATEAAKGAIISGDLSQQDWEPDYYRSFIEQSDLYTLYDSITGAFQQVKSKMKLDDDEYAELITVYVQSIPYESDKVIWSPKFPVETVYEGEGDCDDKSILLNALLAEEGYNSAFLSFGEEEHMAAGIVSTTGIYKDTGYVFIETSDVDYIGSVPSGLASGMKLTSTPLVIKTGESTGMTYNAYPITEELREALEKAWDEQEDLEPEIEQKWELLSEKMSEMELLKPRLEENKSSGDIENYNLLVEDYNVLCGEYTNMSEEYTVLTKRYDALGELARSINERRYDRSGVYDYLTEWEELFGWAS